MNNTSVNEESEAGQQQPLPGNPPNPVQPGQNPGQNPGQQQPTDPNAPNAPKSPTPEQRS